MNAPRPSTFLALLWLLPLAAQVHDVRRIQDRFLAPCCWQQSVAVHNSDVASEMRTEIARMVADGKSEEEIVDVYVARHGERILREPRGYNLIVSILVPLVLLTAASAWLLAFIRRHRQAPKSVPEATELPTLPDMDLD